jgi:hypothetical protein
MNNGGESAALAGAPHAHDFFEEVHRLPVKISVRRPPGCVNQTSLVQFFALFFRLA